MSATVATHGVPQTASRLSYREELLETLRVLAVAGLGWGLLGAGLGGRLAMFLLRLTSPDAVRGTKSDDGFVIGQLTLSGTYNLAMVGAVAGLIATAGYLVVAPWLVGPPWLRRLTVATVGAAIAGSGLVHYEGVDFQALKPQWFAVGLFILLPFMFGLLLPVVVEAVGSPASWTRRGRLAWALPLALTALVATSELRLALVLVAAMVAALLPLRRLLLERIRSSRVGTTVTRAGFLAIAVVGFVSLAQDLADFM